MYTVRKRKAKKRSCMDNHNLPGDARGKGTGPDTTQDGLDQWVNGVDVDVVDERDERLTDTTIQLESMTR